MSIKGFKLTDNSVEQYDYNYLDNIPGLDTTLTSTTLAAQGKTVGDAVSKNTANLAVDSYLAKNDGLTIFRASGVKTKMFINQTTGADRPISQTNPNNWAYLDYIPIIPGAILRFPWFGIVTNVFFYDKDKNYLGCLGTNSEFYHVGNTTYQNDDAYFARFAYYSANGYQSSYDSVSFCYTFEENYDKHLIDYVDFKNGYYDPPTTYVEGSAGLVSDIVKFSKKLKVKDPDAAFSISLQCFDDNLNHLYTMRLGSQGFVPANCNVRFAIGRNNSAALTVKDIKKIIIEEINDIQPLNGAINDICNTKNNGVTIFHGSGVQTKTVIDRITGIEHIISQTNPNNWAYLDYIVIPQGATLYFPWFGIATNAFFYDKDKNYLGCLDSSQEFIHTGNIIYQNSSAAFVRFAYYNSNGYQSSYDSVSFCYTFDNNLISRITNIARFQNGYYEASGYVEGTSGLVSDIIRLDNPVEVYDSENIFNIRVIYYDDNNNFIYRGAARVRCSIPSDCNVRIAIQKQNSGILTVEDITSIFAFVSIDGFGYGFPTSGKIGIDSNLTWVCNIDKKTALEDLMIICEDWTQYSITVAFYNETTTTVHLYNQARDIIIPKGTIYRVAAKQNTATVTDRHIFDNAVHIIPINYGMRAFANIQLDGINATLSFLKKRIAAFENRGLPSYYTSHVQTKVQTIENLYRSTGLAQFIFFTDHHTGGYNLAANTRPLFDYLLTHTHIKRIFNGGDLIKSGAGSQRITTRAECLDLVKQSMLDTIPNEPAEYYVVIGNHDTGLDYDGQGGEFGPYITTDELIDTIGQKMYAPNLTVDPYSHYFQYFFDDNTQNIRYLVSNITMQNLGADEGWTDSYRFLYESLLSTPNGYSVVFFAHRAFENQQLVTAFRNTILPMLDAYNARSDVTLDNFHYNYVDAVGEVVCVIAGHTHYDIDATSQDGIPVIATTSNNAGAEATSISGVTRTIGTVSEHAFDVYTIDTTNRRIYATRIGAGSDRQYNFRTI